MTIKNYSILNKIGEGSVGSIYKAVQNSTGQIVAIKVLKVDKDIEPDEKGEFINQLNKEVELCAAVNHPNIVQLIDRGYLNNGLPYVVYEFIEGETLSTFLLRKKNLPIKDMVPLMKQVLKALVFSHKKGIVHRDLKPQNIMVSDFEGEYHVKILDYGIGTLIGCGYKNIHENSLFGTPAYCAPEQLLGTPPTIKLDLYAWGLIVIECLTGKPAIDGTSVNEIIQQQLSNIAVSIPSFLANSELEPLLKKVLEKDPIRRISETMKVFNEFKAINFKTINNMINDSSELKNNTTQKTIRISMKTMKPIPLS